MASGNGPLTPPGCGVRKTPSDHPRTEKQYLERDGWVIRPTRGAFAAIDLREAIDSRYRSCPTVSDGLESDEAVFSPSRHRSVGKETGETAHMERWNTTLRQRIGRMVRKTLSRRRRCTSWSFAGGSLCTT